MGPLADADQAASAPMPIGVVTGLVSEVRALAGVSGVRALCLGPGPDKAEAAARAVLAEGARALVSAGICGALDPVLRPGDVILPAHVVDRHHDRRAWPADADWHAAVAAALAAGHGRPVIGSLLGSDRPVVSVEGKRHLADRTGCVAVDMESHAVARVAADAGVPFLVLRAVADTAQDALPPWLGGMLDRDGTPNAGVALRRLLAGPWRLPGLLRLAGRSRAAERSLAAVAVALTSPVGD